MTQLKDVSLDRLIEIAAISRTKTVAQLIIEWEEHARLPRTAGWKEWYIAKGRSETHFHGNAHGLNTLIQASIPIEQILFTYTAISAYINENFIRKAAEKADDGYFRIYAKMQDLITMAREDKLMVNPPVFNKYREIQDLLYQKMPTSHKSMSAAPRAYEYVELVDDGFNPTAASVNIAQSQLNTRRVVSVPPGYVQLTRGMTGLDDLI